MRRAKKSDMTLKIVQLNLGKNAMATDELRYQAANDRIDIVLVQETYVPNSFLAGAFMCACLQGEDPDGHGRLLR